MLKERRVRKDRRALKDRRKMHVTERYFPIGNNLYRLRREQALTQRQLAERAGIDKITISNLERGAQNAAPETVQRLAEALHVEIRDLTIPGSN